MKSLPTHSLTGRNNAIQGVFDGREPTINQVKRELFEYWELLERLGE
jgi:hypothetical protein